MSPETKQFIKNNQNNIQKGDFDTLYYNAENNLSDDLGELTDILYQAGINPMAYFTQDVPHDYMYKSQTAMDINLPTHITRIASDAFRYSKVQNVSMKDVVTVIGSHAFADSTIESLQLSNQLEMIPRRMCENCVYLRSIEIPSNVLMIRRGAFNGCNSLENVTLHEGLEDIRDLCFSNCPNLKSIFIPTSVYRISAQAFDKDILLLVKEKSEAHQFAIIYGFNYKLV